jgi:hypothetical protein
MPAKSLTVVTDEDLSSGVGIAAPLSARGRHVLFSALSVQDEAAEAVAAGKKGLQVSVSAVNKRT